MNRNRFVCLLIALNILTLGFLALREVGEILPSARAASPAAPTATPPAPNASARRTEIVVAAEHVSPAIVSVGASQTGYLVSPFSGFFQDFEVYPYQQKIPYLGSGVIVDSNGLIITNHHVVEDTADVFVTLMDGREFQAKVLDADPVLDVAVLKVDAKELPTVRLGSSDDLLVGEWVLAMGNPFGNLIADPRPSVTVGVVSALKRSFRPSMQQQRVYQDMIQTDAAINPGNSGGALINTAGELVGINTFIMSRSGGAEGIGFAIPVNRVKAILEEIVQHGKIRVALRDFSVQNTNDRIRKLLGTKADKGAVVSEIRRRGPAEKAGLRVGDVILQVDGRPVKDADDLTYYMRTQQVGNVVKLGVDRGGQMLQVDYTMTEARQQ